MSGKLRHEVEKMKDRYARAFDVPRDEVEVTWLDDDNASIGHGKHPRWSYGPICSDPKR